MTYASRSYDHLSEDKRLALTWGSSDHLGNDGILLLTRLLLQRESLSRSPNTHALHFTNDERVKMNAFTLLFLILLYPVVVVSAVVVVVVDDDDRVEVQSNILTLLKRCVCHLETSIIRIPLFFVMLKVVNLMNVNHT